MKNSNFITIQGWMVNELGLSGNELLLYALIYGFSQDDKSEFNLSLSYTTSWLNVSKQTVLSTLKKLLEKNLISKVETKENGIKVCKYLAVNNFDDGGQESLPPPSQKSLPHSNKDIIYNNIIKEHTNIKDSIERWLQYKKERKESYTPTGLNDCIEKLEELSGGNPDLAMSIVKQSTSNGWAGLFALKNAPTPTQEQTFLVEAGKFFIDDDETYCKGYSDLVVGLPQERRDSLCQWFLDKFEGKEIKLSFIRNVLTKAREELC